MIKSSIYFDISIPAPRAGSDARTLKNYKTIILFQSPLPCGEATTVLPPFQFRLLYFNPRSPCGERRRMMDYRKFAVDISIPAPRAGSDVAPKRPLTVDELFQSPLPVRGATLLATAIFLNMIDFNPRSPCGERPARGNGGVFISRISIPAPRAGSDVWLRLLSAFQQYFIPAPVRGANTCGRPIHQNLEYFNPRSPCGERPSHLPSFFNDRDINPRAPCGGATSIFRVVVQKFEISIPLPVRGAT